jgi:hypothetical protein
LLWRHHSGNPDALGGVESLQRCDRRRAIRLFDLPNPSGMRQFEDPSGTSTLVAEEGAIFHVKKKISREQKFYGLLTVTSNDFII